VSNEEATIRRMFGDSYVIPNVSNYCMFTNYWDGLPFSRMDRRYYVVATSFQTKEQMDAWNAKHPRYFSDLYDAIRDHGEVLRHWFMTRPLSPKFQPKRPALDTAAKHKMRDLSENSDETDVLADILEESTDPEVSDRLLNADKLKAAYDTAGQACPYGRALSTMLAKAGFLFIGRFRVEGAKGSPNVRFYTRQPGLFQKHKELEMVRTIQTENLLAFDAGDEDPFA
jgi:hypothetical protein